MADKQVVITQPSKGDYLAFSALCTHQGCTVANVTDNTIVCPCHGSEFSAENGEVLGGPATTPLAAVPIEVDGTEIRATT